MARIVSTDCQGLVIAVVIWVGIHEGDVLSHALHCWYLATLWRVIKVYDEFFALYLIRQRCHTILRMPLFCIIAREMMIYCLQLVINWVQSKTLLC